MLKKLGLIFSSIFAIIVTILSVVFFGKKNISSINTIEEKRKKNREKINDINYDDVNDKGFL